MVLGYTDLTLTILNEFITYVLIIVVNLILLCSLLRSSNQSQINKKLVVICIILSLIAHAMWIGYKIVWYYLRLNPSNDHNIDVFVTDISQFLYAILIGYFWKLMYEETYKHSFFKLNKLYSNVSFIIYTIFTCIPHLFYILVYALGYKKYSKHLSLSILFLSVLLLLYSIQILILFKMKLRKFRSLINKNDAALSHNVNKRFTDFVSKQSKLIIIIIVILIDTVIFALWSWFSFDHELLSCIWYWTHAICYSITGICSCLLVDTNCCCIKQKIIDADEFESLLSDVDKSMVLSDLKPKQSKQSETINYKQKKSIPSAKSFGELWSHEFQLNVANNYKKSIENNIFEDEKYEQLDDITSKQQKIVTYYHDNYYGQNEVFESPFGVRPVIYCDWTASGKVLECVERYLSKEMYTLYANTHT
eukprot:513465_1